MCTRLPSFVLTLIAAVLVVSFSAYAAESDDQSVDTIVSYEEPRSMAGGLFMAAVFPGFIVHGSGNYYAGAKTTGAIMTGAEILGGGLIVAGSPPGDSMSSIPVRTTPANGCLVAVLYCSGVRGWPILSPPRSRSSVTIIASDSRVCSWVWR